MLQIHKGKTKMTTFHRYLKSGLLAAAATLICASPSLREGAVPSAFAQQGGNFASAQAFYASGNYRRAAEALKGLAAAAPKDPRIRVLQAKTYLGMQLGIAAQTAVESARQSGANRDDTRPLMAEAMVQQRRFADALTEANAGSAVPAQIGESARVRALAYLGLKQFDKAATEFNLAARTQPNDVGTKLDMAKLYSVQRDLAKSEGVVDEALRIQPRNIRALLIKGDITRTKPNGGMTKALPYFEQALQIDPQSMEALIERAATYTDLRREPEALQDIGKLMKMAPEHPVGLYLQAVMASRKQRFQDAGALMSRTKGALDSFPPALMLQGLISYESGNMEQATSYLSKVLEAAPNSVVARRLMGAALLRRGNADDAINMLKPLFDTGQADSRLLALMGSAYARKNDFKTAEKYLQDAVQAEPKSSTLRTQLAMTRLALGQNVEASSDLKSVLATDPKSLQAMVMSTLIDLRSRNFKGGLASSQKLVATYPNLPVGYNMLAAAYLGMGDLPNAEKNFLAAVAKKPDYHEARRNLAQLYIVSKPPRFEDARRELNKVLSTDRNNVKTMLLLGDIARMQGKTDEFVQWLQKAVAVNPKLLPTRLALVSGYMQTGDKTRAMNEIAAMNREFPDNITVIETLGKAQASSGNFRDAITTFQQLSNKAPNNIAARQLLGRAQWSNKQRDEARKTFQRALGITSAPGRGFLLLDLMNLEAEAGNYEAALGYAGEMRKAFPGQNLADKTMGDLFMGNQQYDKAAVSYEAAAKVSFDKVVALNLSRAYSRLKQTDKAVSSLRRWQAGKPFDAGVGLAIGQLYIDSGNNPAAVREYEAIIKSGKVDPSLLNNLAWVYDKTNDPRALATAQRAYKMAPDRPEIADTLGWITLRKVDKRQGLALIQKAAEKLKDPGTQYHMAFALQANGRTREAIALLDTVLASYKTFAEINQAKALLAQLKGATGAR
jgi:cellulose synthase operon protein C